MDTTIKLVLQDVVRRVWLIILCGILGIVAAYFYTEKNVAPVYTTQMKVSALTNLADDEAVSSVGSFINMMTLAERRVQAYLEFYKTKTFYQHIAEHSGTGYSAGAVGSMLEFSQVEGMGIFYVKITGADADAVYAVAQAIEDQMLPFIDQYQSRSSIDVIEHSYKPSQPINQEMKGNCIKGGILFAALCVAILAVRAFFDTHIKDEETLVKRYSDVPVLGKIPDFTQISGKSKRKS